MLALVRKVSNLMFVVAVLCGAGPTRADTSCDPVVNPVPGETSLAQLLELLSVAYNFDLILPDGFDAVVERQKSMKLNQLIQSLTSDMNTVLRHENIDGCVSPRLVELSIISAGQDSEYLNKGLPVDILWEIPSPEKSQ